MAIYEDWRGHTPSIFFREQDYWFALASYCHFNPYRHYISMHPCTIHHLHLHLPNRISVLLMTNLIDLLLRTLIVWCNCIHHLFIIHITVTFLTVHCSACKYVCIIITWLRIVDKIWLKSRSVEIILSYVPENMGSSVSWFNHTKHIFPHQPQLAALSHGSFGCNLQTAA